MTDQGRLEMSTKLSPPQLKRGPGTLALEEHSTSVQNVGLGLHTPLAMVRDGGTCPPRILLVDDEENVILTMKAGLQVLLDCEVTTATSGQQALRLFEEKPFDLLITDYKMPDMDGMTLSARVRQSYPRTAIVMVTAYVDNDLRKRAAQVPIQCVLEKPVNLPDVRMAILEILNGPHEE